MCSSDLRNLLLYENKKWSAPVEKVLRIRMLTLSHDVEVPLDQFDFVRKQNQEPDPATRHQ